MEIWLNVSLHRGKYSTEALQGLLGGHSSLAMNSEGWSTEGKKLLGVSSGRNKVILSFRSKMSDGHFTPKLPFRYLDFFTDFNCKI